MIVLILICSILVGISVMAIIIPYITHIEMTRNSTHAQRRISFNEFRDIFQGTNNWDKQDGFPKSFFKDNPTYNIHDKIALMAAGRYSSCYTMYIHASIISHWGTGLIIKNPFEYLKFQYFLYGQNKLKNK